MKRKKLPKCQTPDMVINENATITVPATVSLNFDPAKLGSAVMLLRGFPDGMAMDRYPSETDCEAASPGICEAQHNARCGLTLPCTITIDGNGNRTVKLIEPKKG